MDGKPVYVPFAAMGDVVEVEVTHHKDHGRATITRILTPSPDREEPFCKHYGTCGGCALQHLNAEATARFKTSLVASALARHGITAHLSPIVTMPRASRRRADFAIHKGRLGYHQRRSKELLPIASCPILHPDLEATLPEWQAWLSGLPGIIQPQALRLTLLDDGVDAVLELSRPPSDAAEIAIGASLSAWNEATGPLRPRAIIGAKSWPEDRLGKDGLDITRLSLWVKGRAEPHISFTPRRSMVTIGAQTLPVPPGAFLQASAAAQDWLTAYMLEKLPAKGTALDLFAGIGGYAANLAMRGQAAHAAELDAAMVENIRQVAKSLPRLTAESRDLFKNPFRASELARFASCVINPPRAGAEAQCRELAKPNNLTHIAMVSCHPESFARDAAILISGGWQLSHAQPLDQFIGSHHVEMAALFTRAA
jgi:23S rRNA (uracil1939-C5)-methyltransferase